MTRGTQAVKVLHRAIKDCPARGGAPQGVSSPPQTSADDMRECTIRRAFPHAIQRKKRKKQWQSTDQSLVNTRGNPFSISRQRSDIRSPSVWRKQSSFSTISTRFAPSWQARAKPANQNPPRCDPSISESKSESNP